MKIVVGASSVCASGWIPTEIDELNILKSSDWARFFKESTIDAILAEHVWEHLSLEEGREAAKLCYRFLKPGGYIRLAVPDGNHPDHDYIEHVKIGVDGHKVLYNSKSLTKIFETAGFEVKLLEFFDENATHHYTDWDPQDGMIHRSKRFDARNTNNRLCYTSIIIDAYKTN